jgi:hypothetical protein
MRVALGWDWNDPPYRPVESWLAGKSGLAQRAQGAIPQNHSDASTVLQSSPTATPNTPAINKTTPPSPILFKF